jgi:hypothetical protein
MILTSTTWLAAAQEELSGAALRPSAAGGLVPASGGGGPGRSNPSPAALLRVRRLQAVAAGLRGLFARVEPDLEFGAFRVLFGPEVRRSRGWGER